jgi:hypothetical protein
MIAKSSDRVIRHTDERSAALISRQFEANLAYYMEHPDQIDQRLRELDEEWDIERVLALNSSGLSLFGLAMGILGSRKWMLVTLVVQGFFLQHTLQGWCPPMPLFRRMGIRTQAEIEAERHALKSLREDYGGGSAVEAGGTDRLSHG